jgi:hypothetical protein
MFEEPAVSALIVGVLHHRHVFVSFLFYFRDVSASSNSNSWFANPPVI